MKHRRRALRPAPKRKWMVTYYTHSDVIRMAYYDQVGETKISLAKMTVIFNLMIENIKEAMIRGDRVDIFPLGRFNPIRMCLRTCNNYSCNDKEVVLTKRLYHRKIFKPSKKLKRQLSIKGMNIFEKYFNDNTD